jgi:protein SCO1/2
VKQQICKHANKSSFRASKHCAFGFVFFLSTLIGGTAPAFADLTQNTTITKTAEGVQMKGDASKLPPELQDIGIKEHLGQQVDLQNLEFISSTDGKKHKLSEAFSEGKPTILNLVYFECPMLCTLVLNGILEGMKGLDWSIGNQYNVVTISINPNDSVKMAQAKKETYLSTYLDPAGTIKRDSAQAHAGWQFFTAEEAQVKKLSEQLGFEYKYDPVEKQYAHPAVTFILTPNGYISRYLYGITYRPRDLRLALLEASQGKVGNVFDRILMFCYHYEPSHHGYSFQAFRAMQLAALVTLAFLAGYLTLFWTRQRKGQTK